MLEPKKKPNPKTFTLELSGVTDLCLEPEKTKDESKPQLLKNEVNEDVLHRLINCVKKI